MQNCQFYLLRSHLMPLLTVIHKNCGMKFGLKKHCADLRWKLHDPTFSCHDAVKLYPSMMDIQTDNAIDR